MLLGDENVAVIPETGLTVLYELPSRLFRTARPPFSPLIISLLTAQQPLSQPQLSQLAPLQWLSAAITSKDGFGQETHVQTKAGSKRDGRVSRMFLLAKGLTSILGVSTRIHVNRAGSNGQIGVMSSMNSHLTTRSIVYTLFSAPIGTTKCTTTGAADGEIAAASP